MSMHPETPAASSTSTLGPSTGSAPTSNTSSGSPASTGSPGIIKAPTGAPDQGKSRARQAWAPPPPRAPPPLPKVGGHSTARWTSGPEGGCTEPPFPHKPPRSLQGRAPLGPLHNCLPFLLLVFSSFPSFFFCKLCPRPRGPALTRRCEPPGGLGRRPVRPGAFVSSALRVAPNSELEDRQRGRRGVPRGAPESACPQLRPRPLASSPSRPRGQGRGERMDGAQAPMAGPRIKESGIRNRIGSRRRRGRGRGGGCRGRRARAPGTASRLFPPPPPLPPRVHCLRPRSSRRRRALALPFGCPAALRGPDPGPEL